MILPSRDGPKRFVFGTFGRAAGGKALAKLYVRDIVNFESQLLLYSTFLGMPVMEWNESWDYLLAIRKRVNIVKTWHYAVYWSFDNLSRRQSQTSGEVRLSPEYEMD